MPDHQPDQMTDDEAVVLMRLLYRYVYAYGGSVEMTIQEMADDLAMSMDVTTDEADELRVALDNDHQAADIHAPRLAHAVPASAIGGGPSSSELRRRALRYAIGSDPRD